MATNSFGNKNFMQPMRRLRMHSGCLVFYFPSFWFGGFFFLFSMCSHQVLKMCVKFPMCSLRHSQQHLSGRDRAYRIRSNFWRLCLIRTGFRLGEPVFLVKVFRLFRLKRIFWVFRVCWSGIKKIS